MKINRMVRISLSTSIMCVIVMLNSSINFSINNIPFTLQTLVLMIIAITLNPIDAFYSVCLYILLGVLGLPVFSGFKGGLDVLLKPTGGYIIAFPFAAYLISYFKGKSFARLFINNIIFGILVIYFIGMTYHSFISKIPYITVLKGMLIFIPFDIIKAILATIIGKKLILININNK